MNRIGRHHFAVQLLGQPHAEFRFPRARTSDHGEQRSVHQARRIRIHFPGSAIRAERPAARRGDHRILNPGGGGGKHDEIAFRIREKPFPKHNITSNKTDRCYRGRPLSRLPPLPGGNSGAVRRSAWPPSLTLGWLPASVTAAAAVVRSVPAAASTVCPPPPLARDRLYDLIAGRPVGSRAINRRRRRYIITLWTRRIFFILFKSLRGRDFFFSQIEGTPCRN